jgi:transposase-like protein
MPAPSYSCSTPECPNLGRDVDSHPKDYHRFGQSAAGARRYRCKLCRRTFSFNEKPTARQRDTHKNNTIYMHLVNKSPFKRICEQVEISPRTLYRKIDFLHAQALAFVAHRERQLANLPIKRLYIACDRQEFTLNWTNTNDKRNVILKAIASVDSDTGYVFGMHTNFDPSLDLETIAEESLACGDPDKSMPFRRHARLWMAADHARMTRVRKHRDNPIGEGTLLLDVAERYAEALGREEIEATDDPDFCTALPPKGVQVHEEYTLYGHFFFLRCLLGNVEKVRFYLDQDSGMRAACFAAYREEILDGRCDAFYVRINKDLTLHQKQRLVKQAEREMGELDAKHPYELSKSSLRLLKILEEMERLETVGSWNDRWLNYPFPDMSEPEKAVCYLTDRGDYDTSHLARHYLKGSLHAVDSYFNQVRTRLSPLQRANHSPSSAGRTWYENQPYDPRLVQKLLDLLRVYRNYCLKSRKDKQTPAMRLGLAEVPIDLDEVINFQPGF